MRWHQLPSSIPSVTLGIALVFLLSSFTGQVTMATDLGTIVASEAECREDLETLRTSWWTELKRDPDSEVAFGILTRWSEKLAAAQPGGPTADEWRALAQRTENGWNRRKMLRRALSVARVQESPWSPQDVGLDRGVLRDWVGLGPIGQNSTAELYRSNPGWEAPEENQSVAGTFGDITWRSLPVAPQELQLFPRRLSSRMGAVSILRTRYSLSSPTTGFLEVTGSGSFRIRLDRSDLVTIDRAAALHPRRVLIPIRQDAGIHTVMLISDGVSLQARLVDQNGRSVDFTPIDPWDSRADTDSELLTDLLPLGFPDLGLEPVDDHDRAARCFIAAAESDLASLDRLLPETPDPGDGAVALALAAEAVLNQIPWLPSELTKSRLDRFRKTALATDPLLVPVRIAQARTLAAEDQVPNAMRELDSLLDIAPESISLWRTRETIARQEGWQRTRSEALNALSQIAPDHPSVVRLQRASAQNQGRTDLAFELSIRLFELDPRLSSGSSLARTYLERGKVDEASRVVTRLERLAPQSIQILRLRSTIARQLGMVDIYRENLLPQWTRWQPDDPAPWDDLAVMELEAGNRERALIALENAAELDPGRAGRADQITHLKAGSPLPGNGPPPVWEAESIDFATVIANAPEVGFYPGANAVLLLDQMVSFADDKNGLTEMVHQVIRLESQEAIESYSTLPTNGETVTVAVHTTDGRVLEPTGGSTAGGYTLPGLEPGAVIEVRTVRREDLPEYRNLALGPFYFQDPGFQTAFHHTEWVVSLPEDWNPEIVSRASAPSPQEELVDHRKRLSWRVDRSARPEPEYLAPPAERIIPNVTIRAPLSWDVVLPQIAGEVIRDDRVTPTLTAAAEEITEGILGTIDRARAIYAAVSERITQGRGGTSATEIWLSREGDRDLVFTGLLRAAGIPFNKVWAGESPERNPWADWTSPRESDFQRLLTELEGEDGTRQWIHFPLRLAPFGKLPRELVRAKALRLSRSGGEWFTMPDLDPLLDAQALIGKVTLKGSPPEAQFNGALEVRALEGARWKEQIKDAPPYFRSSILEQFVQRTLPGSQVNSGQFENYDNRDQPFRIAFDVDAPSLIQDRQGVTSLASTILPSQLRRLFLRNSERNYPVFSLISVTLEERVSIELGSRLQVEEAPEDLQLSGPWGKFVATSKLEGSSLQLERTLELRPFLVGANRFEELTEFCRQVDRREEARVSLKVVTP